MTASLVLDPRISERSTVELAAPAAACSAPHHFKRKKWRWIDGSFHIGAVLSPGPPLAYRAPRLAERGGSRLNSAAQEPASLYVGMMTLTRIGRRTIRGASPGSGVRAGRPHPRCGRPAPRRG